jgi:gamma-glutamyltranspeptidase / glutathione hydrolase
MGPAPHGIVAAGHPDVARAAAEVLGVGGNAFDAAVAAGFASAVAEPTLTGLGGGGFLLARTAEGDETLFDFFVETPGRGLPGTALDPDFVPVTVRFPSADQVFNVGMGSVAVPGALAGYLHVHDRLGRLDLADVLAPAIRLADDGTVLNGPQGYLVGLLAPILGLTEAGRAIFAPEGPPLAVGERLVNHELAGFLADLGGHRSGGFHEGPLAERIHADMAAGAGLVTSDDLAAYRVHERTPLALDYRGHRILTNPEPAFGGVLVATALRLAERRGGLAAPWGSADHLVSLVEVMVGADLEREAVSRAPRSSGGTTHVSISDAEGNAASMTTSNGEGSGYVVPGTGVMLNNMLGEDDLHPEGFHADPPGLRVGSMMAPTLAVAGERVVLVVGSGGSKRIRTAIPQVLSAILEFGLDPAAAVEAPRLHWDGEVVHAEPGFDADALAAVAARWPVRAWTERNLFFGGAHAVVPGAGGGGDPRRGGAVATVPAPPGRSYTPEP